VYCMSSNSSRCYHTFTTQIVHALHAGKQRETMNSQSGQGMLEAIQPGGDPVEARHNTGSGFEDRAADDDLAAVQASLHLPFLHEAQASTAAVNDKYSCHSRERTGR
jgi:hypothetical protein